MKLMVVDDNVQIRDGICRGIDWAEYGFEEVREYADGSEAAGALGQFQPHVIIADICMPRMDGLELLKIVRQRLKICKYILLSAYSEFAYAQQAIRLGADDYILKPVRPGKLIELVTRCREELETRNRESEAYLQTLEKSVLHSLTVEHRTSDDGKVRRLLEERYGVLLPQELLYIGILRRGQGMGQEEAVWLRETLAERLAPEACAIPISREHLLVIGRGMHSQAANLEAWTALRGHIESLNRGKAPNAVVEAAGISQAHPISGVDEAYAQACAALEMTFYRRLGACAVYGYDRETWKRGIPPEYRRQLREEAEGILRQGDAAAFTLFLTKLRDWGRRERYEPAEMRRFLEELWRVWGKVCGPEEYQEPWREPSQMSFDGLLEAMEGHMGVYLKSALGFAGETSSMVREICEFLNGHYMEQVTAYSVAEAFARTPNYISAKFKREMGKSFTDYLMEVRIRRAVYLLENSGLPVQEIAERTGFGSYAYFSRMLRKNTGKSAGEIREKKKQTGTSVEN